MAHNVYNHIQAIQEVNRLADIEYNRKKFHHSDWPKNLAKAKHMISDHIPNRILFFKSFVEELLDPSNPDPYKMLQDYADCLESISFGKKKNDMFNEHFDVNVTDSKKAPTGEDMADMYDMEDPDIDE
jgi:hypothetical protein